MTTKYAQGRETEYHAQRQLAADGWPSVRSAGSKKAADIIAFNENGSRYIQCKRYTNEPGTFTTDIGKLMSLRLPPNASAELWVKKAGTAGWVERTLIKHTFKDRMDIQTLDDLGVEEAFTRPINPDEVTKISQTISKAAKEARWKSKQAQVRKQTHPAPTTTQWLAEQRSSTASLKTAIQSASGMETPPKEPEDATPASRAEAQPRVAKT